MLARLVFLTALPLTATFFGGCSSKDASLSASYKAAKYKAGQVWSYKTRPHETTSSCIILKVESYPKFGNIVYVALTNLKVKNPQAAKGLTDSINFMPCAESAIDGSVIKLLRDDAELPDYRLGYESWKKQFESGKTGILTTNLAESVDAVERMMSQ
jgi:hypothetical protein